MALHLPSRATLLLSLLAGAVTVLNITTLHFGFPWTTGLAIALVWAASLGISPLTGVQFRAALNLTQGESAAIASMLTAVQLALITANLDSTWHAALSAVVVVAAGLGFGPNTSAQVAAERRPAARPAQL